MLHLFIQVHRVAWHWSYGFRYCFSVSDHFPYLSSQYSLSWEELWRKQCCKYHSFACLMYQVYRLSMCIGYVDQYIFEACMQRSLSEFPGLTQRYSCVGVSPVAVFAQFLRAWLSWYLYLLCGGSSLVPLYWDASRSGIKWFSSTY